MRKFFCAFFLVFSVATSLKPVYGKTPLKSRSEAAEPSFSWSAERRLRWEDFQGTAPTHFQGYVAAITACGIGYYTNSVAAHERPVITVYNSFYIRDSWVRQESADERVLQHEQGHFDLCEVYTRKLRQQIAAANITGANMKRELERLYTAVSREYEARQQAYEAETGHGTIAAAQQRWTSQISQELNGSQYWASR